MNFFLSTDIIDLNLLQIEDDLNILKMEDDLIFLKMEDDPNFWRQPKTCQMEDDLIFKKNLQMEDDLNILVNQRQPSTPAGNLTNKTTKNRLSQLK